MVLLAMLYYTYGFTVVLSLLVRVGMFVRTRSRKVQVHNSLATSNARDKKETIPVFPRKKLIATTACVGG